MMYVYVYIYGYYWKMKIKNMAGFLKVSNCLYCSIKNRLFDFKSIFFFSGWKFPQLKNKIEMYVSNNSDSQCQVTNTQIRVTYV